MKPDSPRRLSIPWKVASGMMVLFLVYTFPTLAYTTNPTAKAFLVSRVSSDQQSDGGSHAPALSADGRYTVFLSYATNLVADDTNQLLDVFVFDRWTSQIKRVSVASDGEQADGEPSRPSISADGRYVAFSSDATNMVHGDFNGKSDVFVHDLLTGETSVVSIASSGVLGNNNSFTRRPALSADGRYVVFYSYANNLVPADGNGFADIFLRDRQTGTTTRISLTSSGLESNGDSVYPTISADGRFVAYYSYADNLVLDDSNGYADVFLYDRQSGQVQRVSLASDGTEGDGNSDLPALSYDGRFIAFYSEATNLVADDANLSGDVFVHDRVTGATTLVSVSSSGLQGNGLSDVPSLSEDGRYVAFYSYADNLVHEDTNGYTDVFRHDRETSETIRVSVGREGGEGNHDSQCSAITADGQVLAFYSLANNLVSIDTNNQADVFLYDLHFASGSSIILPYVSGY